MSAARYDFLLKLQEKHGTLCEMLVNFTKAECQKWIDEETLPGQVLHVREISLDEYARDVTNEYFPSHDDDAARLRFGRKAA